MVTPVFHFESVKKVSCKFGSGLSAFTLQSVLRQNCFGCKVSHVLQYCELLSYACGEYCRKLGCTQRKVPLHRIVVVRAQRKRT
jgi:hypothetical protein